MADNIIGGTTPQQVSPCAASGAINYSSPCLQCSLQEACRDGSECPTPQSPVTFLVDGCSTNPLRNCAKVQQEGETWKNFQLPQNLVSGNNCVFGQASYCTLEKPNPAFALSCCLGEVNAGDQPRQCGGLYCRETCQDLDVVRDYCSRCENLLSPGCQLYCPIGDTRNRASWCDDAFRNFCTTSIFAMGQPACQCFNSPLLQVPAPTPPPVCFDPVCSTQGYKTPDMQAQAENCPNFCQAAINCVNAGTCNISQVTIDQVCGQNGNGGNGGDTFFTQIVLGLPVWLWLIIIGGIFLFFLIAGFTYYRYSSY